MPPPYARTLNCHDHLHNRSLTGYAQLMVTERGSSVIGLASNKRSVPGSGGPVTTGQGNVTRLSGVGSWPPVCRIHRAAAERLEEPQISGLMVALPRLIPKGGGKTRHHRERFKLPLPQR